jgi:BirA family biotin operon repressor/biotin-[acetyl-CoA-carboxylase] ligase
MTNDKLDAAVIARLSGLSPSLISVFDSLPSTNTYLSERAGQGAENFCTVLAESQTAGRGRMGRSFFSPMGSGIYMSLVLRPKSLHAGRLTTLAAVVVSDAISSVCGIKVDIKWVNDLLFGGKKLCGILAESAGGGFAVLGIGINVRRSAFPSELRDIATSLEDICGTPPDRNLLVAEILKGFMSADLDSFSHMADYRRRCVTLGKEAVIVSDGEPVFVLDVADDGALIVRGADGNQKTVFSGEVSVRVTGKEQI